MKLLFVCTLNSCRSPEFEKWIKKNRPQYEVRSAGCYGGYPYRVDYDILNWADKVYLMDLSHERFIRSRFPDFLSKCEIIGIDDIYVPGSEDFNGIIMYWATTRGI